MSSKPTIGIALGDPCGIGPELIARLLVDDTLRSQANVLIVGDPWLLEEGARVAGVDCPVHVIQDLAALTFDDDLPVLLEYTTIAPDAVRPMPPTGALGAAERAALEAWIVAEAAR